MKRAFLLLLLGACYGMVALASLPPKPDPFAYVNDYARIFPEEKRAALESRLEALADSTTNEIVVVTTLDLDEYAPADYAQRLGEAWGIGDARLDNGALILLKPRTETESGKVYIATGYGTEGVLTDVMAGHIIDSVMMGPLREGRYYDAVEAAVNQIEPRMTGEWNSASVIPDRPVDEGAPPYGWLLAGLALTLYFLLRPAGKRRLLNAIECSATPRERDLAVAAARKAKISEKKIAESVSGIPARYLKRMEEAATPADFEMMGAVGLSMGLTEPRIDRLRGAMPEKTLTDVRNCRAADRLDSLAARALAFGNSRVDVDRAAKVATAAMAAIAAAAVAATRAMSRGSGTGRHRSSGGGSFGGGGAGRSF